MISTEVFNILNGSVVCITVLANEVAVDPKEVDSCVGKCTVE
jgi:hypothetical protein